MRPAVMPKWLETRVSVRSTERPALRTGAAAVLVGGVANLPEMNVDREELSSTDPTLHERGDGRRDMRSSTQ